MMARKSRALAGLALVAGLVAGLAGAGTAHAQSRGHDPCFARKAIPADKLQVQRWVVVMLDETTVFTSAHQAEILKQLEPLVQPGTGLKIFRFSAFLKDRNMAETADIRVPARLEEAVRYDMRKEQVKDFDLCQTLAQRNAAQAVRNEVRSYFESASADVPRSEIISSLKSLGDAVLPRIKTHDLRLVIVSDMLEHSDFGSFYGQGAPRRIDAAGEHSKLRARNLATDLRRARVYVIGAGTMPPAAAGQGKNAAGYRPGEVMASLQAFWSHYIEESNGKLAGFGKPMLLTPIAGE